MITTSFLIGGIFLTGGLMDILFGLFWLSMTLILAYYFFRLIEFRGFLLDGLRERVSPKRGIQLDKESMTVTLFSGTDYATVISWENLSTFYYDKPSSQMRIDLTYRKNSKIVHKTFYLMAESEFDLFVAGLSDFSETSILDMDTYNR